MSLIVHHLNNSRSQRILWLLEEIGAPYEIRHYQRDAVTNLAPPELKAVHPLGKSPLLEDDGRVIQESGAIVEYLCERHGGDALVPPRGTDDHVRHLELLHFAEGSAMTLFSQSLCCPPRRCCGAAAAADRRTARRAFRLSRKRDRRRRAFHRR